jgi:predicted nucleic acid-binding protein
MAAARPSAKSLHGPVTFTVDASVFLNAFNPYEEGHEESKAVLARMQADALPIIVPNLLRVEAAAAIARGHGDAKLAHRFAESLIRLPHLVVVPLDDRLAATAAGLAADRRLRGADAVYGAVALRFGSGLVSRDQEQLERLAEVIPTFHPRDVKS